MIERIIAQTRADVEQRMRVCSLDGLQAKATKSNHSLSAALSKGRSSVILECKKASPSMGVIRSDFNINSIVAAYDPFADAISVITNKPFFDGDFAFLEAARRHTLKPLLCKDFILTPYQIYEARVHGADAVLLMMSLLDDAEFQKCFETARSLNMEALVEVHDEEELARALKLGAAIIGVNNRDFRTLKVDLTTSERLLPKIPKDKIGVFESGISSHEQLSRNRGKANAFLIGTSLMQQPDLEPAIRKLLFGRVKVCGLTQDVDAKMAHELGATFGGLIFAPESPRCITLAEAKALKQASPLRFVGVFVNQPLSMISDYVRALNLSVVQLHGEEDTTFISELRQLLPKGVEIWKAVRVQDTIPAASEVGCDRILLDAFQAGKRGGTGATFDWSKLQGLDREHYILSGGLNPRNAREADELGMWALDVNSGVESAPGIKNAELLKAFMEELR